MRLKMVLRNVENLVNELDGARPIFHNEIGIEMDEKRIDHGSTPDGVISDEVKNLNSGIAIMRLLYRGT